MKRLLMVAFVALVLAGCGSSESDDFFVFPGGGDVPPPPNPPIAVNDNYDAFANAPIVVAAAEGVLANDTVNGATITAFDNPSADGGVVNLAGDGSFTYAPPGGGIVGANDTFTYTLTNAGGASVATVTITALPGVAVFVDNSNPNPPGDGSFADPFTTVAAAVAASAAGDTIFVFQGAGPYNEAVNLLANQSLVGEGSGLLTRGDIRAQTVVPPNGFPVITGTVTLADNNTVQGLRFEDITGIGVGAIVAPFVDGTPQVTDGTIVGNQLVENSGGIILNDADGTWTITGNTFQDNLVDITVSGSLLAGQQTLAIAANDSDGSGRFLFLGVSGATQAEAQVVGNTATNVTDPSSFLFTVGIGSPTLCVDLEGNSTNTNYHFQQADAAVLNVLNVADIQDLIPVLNTGVAVTSLGTITPINGPACP